MVTKLQENMLTAFKNITTSSNTKRKRRTTSHNASLFQKQGGTIVRAFGRHFKPHGEERISPSFERDGLEMEWFEGGLNLNANENLDVWKSFYYFYCRKGLMSQVAGLLSCDQQGVLASWVTKGSYVRA